MSDKDIRRYVTLVRAMMLRGLVYINLTVVDRQLFHAAKRLGYVVEVATCNIEITNNGRIYLDSLEQS